MILIVLRVSKWRLQKRRPHVVESLHMNVSVPRDTFLCFHLFSLSIVGFTESRDCREILFVAPVRSIG